MQNIPTKPPYLSDDEYSFILDRDERRCALFGDCQRSGQSEYCDQTLDFDHVHPVQLGGDDSFANVRLLCTNRNRGRDVVPDAKWAAHCFWDSHWNRQTLREIQMIAGPDAIGELSELIKVHGVQNLRRALLGKITLIPGATGIGKCLLMQSVFFSLNELIGPGNPRIGSVLWLTNDTTLRDLGEVEIRTEGVELGLVESAPIVHIAKRFSDLEKGPMGAAVTMSCPQSLWKSEGHDGPLRTDAVKRHAMAHFDTIVFDECDWANEEVRHISRIASHAWQFAASASPPVLEGVPPDIAANFLRRFVIIGPGAIADYTRAVQLDGCLKLLSDPIPSALHDEFNDLYVGNERKQHGKMSPAHPLFRSTILQAVHELDQLETSMKQIAPSDYYSPHLMVRMDSIEEIKAMVPDLEQGLEWLYKDGTLENLGWGVTCVFGGHESKAAPAEKELSAKNKKGWVHPFMLAKNTQGRATAASKRILLMCNIGIRGINNWPVNAIVDCSKRVSVVERVQLNYGRAIRLPSRLSHWLVDEQFKDFVVARMYIPTTLYDDSDNLKSITDARDFIDNMVPKIANAGFYTWSDVLNGEGAQDHAPLIDTAGPPLTEVDKFMIQGALADKLVQVGSLNPEDVEQAISYLPFSERKRQKAARYAEKLLDPSFRDNEMKNTGRMANFEQHPVPVMVKLGPKDVYTTEELIRFVKQNPFYNGSWQAYVQRLQESDELIKRLISDQLRSQQRIYYRPPIKIRRLVGTKPDPGVLLEVANELSHYLILAGQLSVHDTGETCKFIFTAARKLFGTDDAKENGQMDHAAYHIAILGRYRTDLQKMARGMMLTEGILGANLTQFANL